MRIIIFYILCITSVKSFACRCPPSPRTFNETVESGWWNKNVIIKAIKLSDTLHGMNILVLKEYCGKVPNDTIRVWGDLGHLCREYTLKYDVGDTVVLNLLKMDSLWPPLDVSEEYGDFELGNCGEYDLLISNDTIKGPIAPGLQEMPLSEFEELVTQGELLEKCMHTNERSIIEDKGISLYPNPTKDKVIVKAQRKIMSWVVYNYEGRVINEREENNTNELKIDLRNHQKGLYFIKLCYENGGQIVSKIMKE